MAGGNETIHDVADLLRFYEEAGVDVALSEEPVDRFAQSRAIAEEAARRRQAASQPPPAWRETATTPAPPPPATPNLTVPSDAAIMAAREAAATCETLDDLRATLAGFEGCNLRHTATNLVFADGNPDARVMFVGEAPGFEEDLQGLPFVGKSGQLLDRMIAAIGLDRSSAYIANVIPWRPPGNRTPTPQETEICRPFIERQITLVDPDVLVLLGGASAKQILKTSEGILRLRGKWQTYDTGRREIRAMATLHPAYLLRQPLQKRLAWRDLLAIKAALTEAPSPASHG
jgi:uracil-DNA glycosylase family 4